MDICPNCGTKTQPGDPFCPKCGHRRSSATPAPQGDAHQVQAIDPAFAPTMPAVLPSIGANQSPRNAAPSAVPPAPSPALLKGRYRFVGYLGGGGMGVVYKAADTQLGNRMVAIKEMTQSGLRAEDIGVAIEAFKREALLLAGLMHPNLPRILDHFTEQGRWYLVMDFIEGQNLAKYLEARGGRLPIEEVLEIGIHLATVLDYLHRQQPEIIFRDLKPSNVMRSPDGHLYLIDFGIARHFTRGQSHDTRYVCTPGYAAPEQSKFVQTTPRADIYSLGVVLYELLSGHSPSQPFFQFVPLQLGQQPVGRELERLIMQMVRENEGERPKSAALIKQTLQRLVTQQSNRVGMPFLEQIFHLLAISRGRRERVTIVPPSLPQAPTVYSTRTVGSTVLTYKGHSKWVLSVAWSPDGRLIASAGDDKTAQVWRANDGQRLQTYNSHHDRVQAVAWSLDGQWIASAGTDRTVQVWQASSGQRRSAYPGHSEQVDAVAWSPNGELIVSASWDWKNTVHVWEADSGRRRLIYDGHAQAVDAVAWSPDGQFIASAGRDKTVQVWRVRKAQRLHTYKGHTGLVDSIAWSPDGKFIASASRDGTVQVWQARQVWQLWQARKTKRLSNYPGHSNIVWCVAWSPDGQLIASASEDGTVQVWQARSGKHIFTYHDHSDSVTSVAWSPDGQLIASASRDKTVRVWQAV